MEGQRGQISLHLVILSAIIIEVLLPQVMIQLEEERETPEGVDDGVSGQRKHVERIAQMVGLTVTSSPHNIKTEESLTPVYHPHFFTLLCYRWVIAQSLVTQRTLTAPGRSKSNIPPK